VVNIHEKTFDPLAHAVTAKPAGPFEERLKKMKPYLHAQRSARKFGGKPEDYLPIHDFLDSSKAHHADMRHRALLHSSFGIFLAEQMFGTNLTIRTGKAWEFSLFGLSVTINTPGVRTKKVSVRDVAEGHVIEDLGRIPAVSEYLEGMPFYEWLGGPKRKKGTTISLDSLVD
jgi:hypothetical protein